MTEDSPSRPKNARRPSDLEPGGFNWYPIALLREEGVQVAHLAVFASIVSRHGALAGEWMQLSRSHIAERCPLSPQRVGRWVNDLVRWGYIERERRSGGGTYWYRYGGEAERLESRRGDREVGSPQSGVGPKCADPPYQSARGVGPKCADPPYQSARGVGPKCADILREGIRSPGLDPSTRSLPDPNLATASPLRVVNGDQDDVDSDESEAQSAPLVGDTSSPSAEQSIEGGGGGALVGGDTSSDGSLLADLRGELARLFGRPTTDREGDQVGVAATLLRDAGCVPDELHRLVVAYRTFMPNAERVTPFAIATHVVDLRHHASGRGRGDAALVDAVWRVTGEADGRAVAVLAEMGAVPADVAEAIREAQGGMYRGALVDGDILVAEYTEWLTNDQGDAGDEPDRIGEHRT